MDFLFFILGFVCLWQGGNYVVDSSTQLAKRYHISDLIIGLTLVSIGTSLPELVVNIIASVQSESDIIIGNLIGSNISNTLLIIGVTGLVSPLLIPSCRLRREVTIYLVICITMLAFFFIATPLYVSILESACLFILFLISLWVLFSNKPPEEEQREEKTSSLIMILGSFSIGCVLLPLGGHWVVASATSIASILGISTAFISLFAIALGTSLPELFTSIIAARQGNSSIAIGNILGSNIFNLTLILGVSGLIQPISFSHQFMMDVLVMAGSGLLLFIILKLTSFKDFSRLVSFFFLISYLCYILFIYMR